MTAKVDNDVWILSKFLGKELGLDSGIKIANYVRLFAWKQGEVFDTEKVLSVQKIAVTKQSCGKLYVGVYDSSLFEKVHDLVRDAPNKAWKIELDAVGFRPDTMKSKPAPRRKISV